MKQQGSMRSAHDCNRWQVKQALRGGGGEGRGGEKSHCAFIYSGDTEDGSMTTASAGR